MRGSAVAAARRARLVFGGLAAGIALGLGAAACSGDSLPPVGTTSSLADSADQVMFNVRFGLIRDGVRRGELFADTAFVFDQSSRMELRGVRANFYGETGALQGTLVSKEATYDSREGILEARGAADVTSTDGRRLTSPELRYLVQQDQVESDSSFVLTEPGRRVEGVGFRADPELNNVNILRTITGSGGAVTIPGQR